ncbi:MAG: metalloprotease [Dehalococcoidia bacterium]|nr:MAG: metalloprotease [Dehalococcoidia bacterium]
MPFDDQRVDVSGVDDRRGRGLGTPIAVGGGGLGLVGILLLLLVNALGGDTSSLLTGGASTSGTGETTAQLSARCNSDGAIDRYEDCYVIKSYNEINEVWASQFSDSSYEPPRLVFFEQATNTGCGTASSEVGPFYCPSDRSVYIDLGFLKALQQRFGAEGRYAQTYIVAHEVGHHLQTLTGTESRVRATQGRGDTQALAIGVELQADCYAGVWSALANRAGNFSISERELDQALNAAAAVGDDRIQQKTQGRVDPERWTHGSAQQRRQAFLTGYEAARGDACTSLVPLRP